MKIKKRFTETPGNRLIHSQKKKNFGRPPRELQCSDRAQTSTTGSGRASCIDVVLRFWLKVLVRRDKFENRRKNHNYTYTYRHLGYSILVSVVRMARAQHDMILPLLLIQLLGAHPARRRLISSNLSLFWSLWWKYLRANFRRS